MPWDRTRRYTVLHSTEALVLGTDLSLRGAASIAVWTCLGSPQFASLAWLLSPDLRIIGIVGIGVDGAEGLEDAIA